MALLSGFYRKRKPGAIVKSEADNRVGDGLAGPVGHDQIDVGHMEQVVAPLFPP